MADFEPAFELLIKHEGGFVNNPNDSGGATKYGVSLRYLKSIGQDINLDGIIDVKDIKDLTLEEAKEIYRKHFWNPLLDKVNSQRLANMIFGLIVNSGESQAIRILQRAFNAIQNIARKERFPENGILTESMVTWANIKKDGDRIVAAYKDKARDFYKFLVESNPKNKVFLFGWFNRLDSY